MGYKHLNYLKRCQILALYKAGYTQTQIAEEVGVHKSTISREFNRNSTLVRTQRGYWAYKPDYAQGYANTRKKGKRKHYKFNEEIAEFIADKIKAKWSPEQISGYAKRLRLFSISHERIYQYLLVDKQKGGDLYKHLRHQNKKYRKRYGSPKRSHGIKNRVMIDDRPKIVDQKIRIGDWEIDTIIGKDRKQAILSIVERVTKFTILKKLKSKNSVDTRKALVDALRPYKSLVHTITSDNGTEFADHQKASFELDADFYFAHPYSSWERGLNENTNGLIRQYLKKGICFNDVDNIFLANLTKNLNNRPRKALSYLTPAEVFQHAKN